MSLLCGKYKWTDAKLLHKIFGCKSPIHFIIEIRTKQTDNPQLKHGQYFVCQLLIIWYCMDRVLFCNIYVIQQETQYLMINFIHNIQ